MCDLLWGKPAFHRLPAGHCHRVIFGKAFTFFHGEFIGLDAKVIDTDENCRVIALTIQG